MSGAETSRTATAPTINGPRSVQLGELKITALQDGSVNLPTSFLIGDDGQSPQIQGGKFHFDINAFLIEAPGQKLLVDTGCGPKLGPTVNNLLSALATAGVHPHKIDAVLCTHIHPDHTNGLIDINGAAVFPHAQVFAPSNDLDYWLSDEQMQRAPEPMKIQFAWAIEAFAPYAGRIKPYERGEIVRGIEALPLFGHTPGHSGFHIDGGGNQQLIIWGDCAHDIVAQTRNPNIVVEADMDQDQARRTRIALFERVAADGVMITGMHVTFPGFGRLRKVATGFEYAPQS